MEDWSITRRRFGADVGAAGASMMDWRVTRRKV